MQTLRRCLLFLYVCALLCSTAATFAKETSPNVVFVLADDLGYNEMNWMNGTRGLVTPHLDELAASGVTMRNYYVGAICSPTRSSLMTGRYTTRLGTQSSVIYWNTPWGVPINETFMGQNFQEAGYDTAMFGKWHLGMFKQEYTPRHRGFDEHMGYYQGCESAWTHIASCCTGGSDYTDQDFVCQPGKGSSEDFRGYDWFKSTPALNNSLPDRSVNNTKSVDLIRDAAIEYIHRKSANPSKGQVKPFFMYLPFQNIHGPHTTQQKYFDIYSDRSKFTEAEATMFGYITELDDAVGDVIEKLKSTGAYDNTVVVFSSDNGAPPSGPGVDHQRAHPGGGAGYIARNYPFRGTKAELWEGGTRVPGFVSGGSKLIPSAARGTSTHELFHVTDWLPTFRAAFKLGSTGFPSDGHDIWEALTTGGASPRHEMLYNVNPLCDTGKPPRAAIRVGRYKLLAWCFDVAGIDNANRTGPVKASKSEAQASDPGFAENDGLVLYDLEEDPQESTNIRARPSLSGAVESMLARLTQIASEMVEPQQWEPPYQGPNYFCANCSKHPGGTGVDVAWDSWL